MFTLQAQLMEDAVRNGSPKGMSQALANCYAPLVHRGSITNTHVPFDGGLPAGGFLQPPGINLGGPQFVDLNFITVDIPPWVNVPFFPQPPFDIPEWVPFDFPPPYYSGGNNYFTNYEPSLTVANHTRIGDTIANNLTTHNINSETIVNEGDLINRQEFTNQGDVIHQGDTIHGGDVINQGDVIHQGNTTHQGDTYHQSNTYLNNTQNLGPVFNHTTVTNYGPVTHEGDVIHRRTVIHQGDTIHNGDTIFEGDVIIEGDGYLPDPYDPDGPPLGPLGPVVRQLLVDIEWDGTQLVKKYRTFTLLAAETEEDDDVVVSGTSCPSTPINAAASNWSDMP